MNETVKNVTIFVGGVLTGLVTVKVARIIKDRKQEKKSK